MEETQMIAIVVALVGMLKMQIPKLVGLYVPVAAVIVGVLVAFAHAELGLSTLGEQLLPLLRTGVRIGLVAVGAMHAVLYGTQKFGDALRAQQGPA